MSRIWGQDSARHGAPGHRVARAVLLYYGLGFRELSRDVPLTKAATAG